MILTTQPRHKGNLLALIIFATSVVQTTELAAQAARYFNNGRTRCYTGGMTFSKDGKTLFHSETFKEDSLLPAKVKIMKVEWVNGAWTKSRNLSLTNHSEVYPLLTPDGNRLYFTSNAPAPGKQAEGDLNIWYADRTAEGWTKPIFLNGINTEKTDRFSDVDQSGNFYLIMDKDGNHDIYKTQFLNGRWTTPVAVAEWNSPQQEEYVSVHEPLGIAFIQRTQVGKTCEIFFSVRKNGVWTTPLPLQYEGKVNQWPYVHRWPRLSADGSTFYLVAHALIWEQSTAKLLEKNDQITLTSTTGKFAPLPISKLANGEPGVFGGLRLKTNNGISFKKDMKTIYVSRYTNERDSSQNQFIKIFESSITDGSWSDFKMMSFCKAAVPFEYHPALSPDGKRMFFNSRAPSEVSQKKYASKNNIWYSEYTENGWGAPSVIASVATEGHDDYASASASGTLYFRSDRPGGKGFGDIYVSRFINGAYQAPENIQDLNSEDNENDVCIDPRERFIIFNRYFDRTKEIKLFLSIRKGDRWSAPRLLKSLERSNEWELTPTLSPDAKYFFYEVNSNIFRVETSTLFNKDELKWID